MNALVLHELPSPRAGERRSFELRLEHDRTRPRPASHEVLVRVRACALNHKDLWITRGLYPGIVAGSVLGGDGAGVVVECGDAGDARQRALLGVDVLFTPVVGWRHGRDTPPTAMAQIGMRPFGDGTFADFVAVDVASVFAAPPHLSFAQAAATPLAGLTAFRALCTKGEVRAGDTLLVPGIGSGVALFVLQFAVALGAHVFVTSSSDAKLARARALGARGGVNYRSASPRLVDALRRELDGRPLDLVVDGAGGAALNDYLALLRPGGRIVSYGATAGTVERLSIQRLFLRQCELRGSTLGCDEEFAEMCALITRARIVPVVDSCVRGLPRFAEQLERMRRGEQFGKLVVELCTAADREAAELGDAREPSSKL